MLPPLNPEQHHVLGIAYDEARQQGASHKEVKALTEALIVESHIRNLSYGDADSLGALQQRPSQGWKHPQNVRLAVRDFLKAARPLRNQYNRASGLAQGVQRSGYPDRYQTEAAKAEALYQKYFKQGGGNAPLGGRVRADVTTTGVSNLSQRNAITQRVALANFLHSVDPSSLLLKLGVVSTQEQVPPPTTQHRNVSIANPAANTSSMSSSMSGKSPLFELFWQGQGGIDVKNGKKVAQGFVTGHQDHVHVAAGRSTVVQLGHLAQQMGLHVGENPHFGGVHPVHVSGSYHYKGQAIDVSGTPQQMRQYAHRVASIYGIH